MSLLLRLERDYLSQYPIIKNNCNAIIKRIEVLKNEISKLRSLALVDYMGQSSIRADALNTVLQRQQQAYNYNDCKVFEQRKDYQELKNVITGKSKQYRSEIQIETEKNTKLVLAIGAVSIALGAYLIIKK